MKVPAFLTQTPIAHRGLHGGEIPENSLAAFEAAARKGYAVETDVRFTRDGQLVAFHDDTVDRMTDASGSVSAFPLSVLRALRLGGTAERIPLFSECLELIAGRVPLLLEIKDMPGVSGAKIAAAVRDVIDRFPALEYAVQSFQPAYPTAYKKLCPAIACGMLGIDKDYKKEDFHNSPLWRIKAKLLPDICYRTAKKLDFISYYCGNYPSDKLRAYRGVKLAWTVRSSEEAERLRPFADNIIFEGFLPALPSEDCSNR